MVCIAPAVAAVGVPLCTVVAVCTVATRGAGGGRSCTVTAVLSLIANSRAFASGPVIMGVAVPIDVAVPVAVLVLTLSIALLTLADPLPEPELPSEPVVVVVGVAGVPLMVPVVRCRLVDRVVSSSNSSDCGVNTGGVCSPVCAVVAVVVVAAVVCGVCVCTGIMVGVNGKLKGKAAGTGIPCCFMNSDCACINSVCQLGADIAAVAVAVPVVAAVMVVSEVGVLVRGAAGEPGTAREGTDTGAEGAPTATEDATAGAGTGKEATATAGAGCACVCAVAAVDVAVAVAGTAGTAKGIGIIGMVGIAGIPVVCVCVSVCVSGACIACIACIQDTRKSKTTYADAVLNNFPRRNLPVSKNFFDVMLELAGREVAGVCCLSVCILLFCFRCFSLSFRVFHLACPFHAFVCAVRQFESDIDGVSVLLCEDASTAAFVSTNLGPDAACTAESFRFCGSHKKFQYEMLSVFLCVLSFKYTRTF